MRQKMKATKYQHSVRVGYAATLNNIRSLVAVASLGTVMIVSSYATSSIEEVAMATSNGHLWFQLYIFKDRSHTEKLIRRAEKAGYKAVVVTVDTPYPGKKLNDERCGGFNPNMR